MACMVSVFLNVVPWVPSVPHRSPGPVRFCISDKCCWSKDNNLSPKASNCSLCGFDAQYPTLKGNEGAFHFEAGCVGFVMVRKKHWFCYILKETLGRMGWPGCQYWFFGNILGT